LHHFLGEGAESPSRTGVTCETRVLPARIDLVCRKERRCHACGAVVRETIMRRSQTSGVAGNCSCCLVPALILLAIIVAAAIGVAVVWHSAMPSVFRLDSGHGPHYDAYRDGYKEGNRLGDDYARRGDAEPRGQDLDELARREADRLHVRRDRGQWIEGFRNGFTRGFEEFNNQASNQPASRSRFSARPDRSCAAG
jgi:hypothetical protein